MSEVVALNVTNVECTILFNFTIEASGKVFSRNIEDLIRRGNNYKVKSYIEGTKRSDLVDSHGTSLFHLAAKYDNYRLTKYRIKIKFNINIENASKTTPLIVAARFSSFKAADLLIQANANIYAINSSNKSALPLLLNNNYILQYLIDSCLEKVKSTSSSDEEIAEKLCIAECPFEYVIYLKNSNVTRMIMNRYGQINLQQSCKALNLAVKQEDQENILALLQCGVEIDFSKIDTALFFDIILRWDYEGEPSLTVIDALLERVNWKSLRKRDLHCFESVFQHGSKNMLELFLQHNINEYVKKKFPGRDLLINNFGNCNANTRELLKNRKFDVNSRNSNDETALHMAVARENSLNDIQTLLELGACPNSGDNVGRVPLVFVHSDGLRHKVNSVSDERKSVEPLLQAGADPQLAMKSDPIRWYRLCSSTKLEMMIAHLVIDESLEKPIEKTICQDIKNFRLTRNIYKLCCQHLEQLKATKVQGSITLYTILVTDPAKIACHLRDREVIEGIMLSKNMKKLHFYYVSKLKKSVNQILHLMDLSEKATAFICDATGLPVSLYLILEKILSFLTYRDLLVFDLL